MRGTIDDLASPHPISERLPALFQEDEFAVRFTSAFDEVLAPVFATLDCLEAYLDPKLAPPDFVAWLATWVGALLDEEWPDERRRDLVAQTVDLYAWRGTVAGLRGLVRIYLGHDPEIEETGAAVWSPVPGGDPPGQPVPQLIVRARVPDPSAVDVKRLDAIVADAKPAHVPHRVEVVVG